MNLTQLISVTLILFSVIDIIGNIPIVLKFKERGLKVEEFKATIVSGLLMILFLAFGESLLALFGVDVNSFAIAGAIVLLILGLEMILGITIMKDEGEINSASIFPIAFPLIAGAGTLTTILSLKSEYDSINILGGIIINLILIFIVLKSSDFIQKKLGKQGAIVLRKVFGIILLAIAVKLFKNNLFN